MRLKFWSPAIWLAIVCLCGRAGARARADRDVRDA